MAEKEYIARETVRNTIKALCIKYNQAFGGHYGGFGEELAKIINNMPATDVVEVVRCKDCKFRKTEECAMFYECFDCMSQHSWENSDDFCSYGKRKDN